MYLLYKRQLTCISSDFTCSPVTLAVPLHLLWAILSFCSKWAWSLLYSKGWVNSWLLTVSSWSIHVCSQDKQRVQNWHKRLQWRTVLTCAFFGHYLWMAWACPSDADTAGSGNQASALVKIKVLPPWEHSCMHSAAKFVLFSIWKEF